MDKEIKNKYKVKRKYFFIQIFSLIGITFLINSCNVYSKLGKWNGASEIDLVYAWGLPDSILRYIPINDAIFTSSADEIDSIPTLKHILYYHGSGSRDIVTNDYRAISKIVNYSIHNVKVGCTIKIYITENGNVYGYHYYFYGGHMVAKEIIKKKSKSLEDIPEDTKARNIAIWFMNRGVIKYKNRLFKSALQDYNNAVLFDPKYPDVYIKRGLLKIELLQNDDGCLDLNKAKELGDLSVIDSIKKYCN